MKFFCSLIACSVLYIGMVSNLDAQENAFGNCSQEKVIKLIDTGFTKQEISKFCGTPVSSSNRPKPTLPSNTSKQIFKAKYGPNILDGWWIIEANCDNYEGNGHKIIFVSGAFTGPIDFGADNLYLEGSVDKNGLILAYGTGVHVLGEFQGKIVDWKNGKAEGTWSANGEAACGGKWVMKRKK